MVKLRGREAYPIYFGASPAMLKLAAELRSNMPKAEKPLWEKLRNRKCYDSRFRRQHPIREFIVDFFCYEAMIAIELDGEIHNDAYQNERDSERTNILNELGIRVIRFTNDAVASIIEEVLQEIEDALKDESDHTKN